MGIISKHYKSFPVKKKQEIQDIIERRIDDRPGPEDQGPFFHEYEDDITRLLKEGMHFCCRYKEEAIAYKEDHLRDRQLPQCYIQYMIAIINNCQTFK